MQTFIERHCPAVKRSLQFYLVIGKDLGVKEEVTENKIGGRYLVSCRRSFFPTMLSWKGKRFTFPPLVPLMSDIVAKQISCRNACISFHSSPSSLLASHI